jgi:hypothetical protein
MKLEDLTTEELLTLQRQATNLTMRSMIQRVLLQRREDARRAERGLAPRVLPIGGKR